MFLQLFLILKVFFLVFASFFCRFLPVAVDFFFLWLFKTKDFIVGLDSRYVI